jgi:hypothetical protein
MNWTLFLAWLCAPDSQQRWGIFTEIRQQIEPVDFTAYWWNYERSLFGQIERSLRIFWTKVLLFSRKT